MVIGLIEMLIGLIIVAIGDLISISQHFRAADFVIGIGVIFVIAGLMTLGFDIGVKWYS